MVVFNSSRSNRVLQMRRDLGIPIDPLEQVKAIRSQMGLGKPQERKLRRSTYRRLL